jgi:hypothetical protein
VFVSSDRPPQFPGRDRIDSIVLPGRKYGQGYGQNAHELIRHPHAPHQKAHPT